MDNDDKNKNNIKSKKWRRGKSKKKGGGEEDQKDLFICLFVWFLNVLVNN